MRRAQPHRDPVTQVNLLVEAWAVSSCSLKVFLILRTHPTFTYELYSRFRFILKEEEEEDFNLVNFLEDFVLNEVYSCIHISIIH